MSDEWKSGNQALTSVLEKFRAFGKALEVVIQHEVQKVEDMKATVEYLEKQKKEWEKDKANG